MYKSRKYILLITKVILLFLYSFIKEVAFLLLFFNNILLIVVIYLYLIVIYFHLLIIKLYCMKPNDIINITIIHDKHSFLKNY